MKIIDLETPVEAAAFEETAEAAAAPKAVEPKVETVDSLRAKLHQAIDKEDFELAARLRDLIREMEQKG